MRTILLSLALVLGMISCKLIYADNDEDLSNQVLKWVKEGKVIAFDVLMRRYRDRMKGRLLDLEVEREKGQIIYELEIMRPDGIVYEIKIDAQSGEWLGEEVEN